MPNEINQDTFRRLAKLGAQARLEQIELERKAILAAFPDLSGRTGAKPGAHRLDGGKVVAAGKPARRRRRMTAAQRKAVSERMKKFWADRRKAKA